MISRFAALPPCSGILPQLCHRLALLALLLAGSVLMPGALAQDGVSPSRTVTCSTTQIADLTRQIVGDRWRVLCVLTPGQDPHTFEVTAEAVAMVRQSDLCLDNGWHLEGRDWMRTIADQEKKPIRSCTDGVTPLRLEQNGESVRDPHAWFSPMNAAKYVGNILQAVSQLDPEFANEYAARAELIREQLRALHVWAKRQFNRVPANRRTLVTSHDAFNYFCQVYGLESAAPIGWSTQEVGAEVTPESRQRVIESIRESGITAIFMETSVDAKSIHDIAREAGVRIGGRLYSDSMGPPGSAGETYFGMMRENIITVVAGLADDTSVATTARGMTTP